VVADLSATRKVGSRRLGDVGALAWVAEQLDLVGIVNRACPLGTGPKTASLGEMVLAVAVQRACAPAGKKSLPEFLDESVARISCLPGKAFSGQAFHRLAALVGDADMERVQVELARAAVQRFGLRTSVLAFDATNFDTYIATTTAGELSKRGHAKSKRRDLRVVGLGLLASETEHVPLLYRTYHGNGSDQELLGQCLDGLGKLHDALDEAQGRRRPAQRTVVRDGGFWSEQLELELEFVGYYSIISLPLGHNAAKQALEAAAKRGAMRSLKGRYKDVRAARLRTKVGELDRTLLVVESQELLEGQKRGIAVALTKAKKKLAALEQRVAKGNITRGRLEQLASEALCKEHLSSFVITDIGGSEKAPSFSWRVDAKLRRKLETTRLGRRVLCTDRHSWAAERIIHGFRGQWNVEELFRRAKGGGVVPWGPSYQWVDASLRLHTFATVLGLMLVSLAKLALGTRKSAKAMMKSLAEMDVTLVRTKTGGKGRRPTVMLAPDLSVEQAKSARLFELDRWLPNILSTSTERSVSSKN
jgi:transposase